jgi:large subunit ribosomal protein L17
MKHHDRRRKLGRVRKQRIGLLRSLAKSLIIHEKIETTEAKAKELRPFIEKLITKGKTNSISARRVVSSRLGNDPKVTKRLFEKIAPKYKERSGGYTRIIKTGTRQDDAAKLARIDFV